MPAFVCSATAAPGRPGAARKPAAPAVCSRAVKAVAVAAAVVALSASMPALGEETAYGQPRVVDGDTFVFQPDKRRVRLKALDAFETKQTCRDGKGAEYLCGIRSKEAMEKIVGRSNILCKSNGNDVFGRMVGTCTREDGLDVGGELVAQGWALSFKKFGKEYVGAEESAHNAHKGAWAGTFEEPWEYRRAVREQQQAAKRAAAAQ